MVLLQRATRKEAISMPAGCKVFRPARVDREQFHSGAFRWGTCGARQPPKAFREGKPFRGQGFPSFSLSSHKTTGVTGTALNAS